MWQGDERSGIQKRDDDDDDDDDDDGDAGAGAGGIGFAAGTAGGGAFAAGAEAGAGAGPFAVQRLHRPPPPGGQARPQRPHDVGVDAGAGEAAAAGGAGAAAGGVGAAVAAAGAGFATQRWHRPAPPFRRRTAYLLQARPQRVHAADAGAFA